MPEKYDEHIDAEWLAAACLSKKSEDVAHSIMNLVNSGQLVSGVRLPTIRNLALRLSVSTSTIANAWIILRTEGYLDTRRRGGTFIIGRTNSLVEHQPSIQLDLSTALPDPTLQFDLGPALIAGLNVTNLHSAELDYVIDPLAKYAESSWPFSAADWTITGASSESILVSISAIAQAGAVVAIEQPTTPRLLQILSVLGITAIGVPWDEEGPQVAALQSALTYNPVAFIFQPRAHLPLGLSMSATRAQALANVLKDFPSVNIIEDDPLGPLCTTPAESIGKWLPDQTILVRSFCKAFGLDLRSTIIGGSASHIAALKKARASGLGMGSRILQGALLHILTNPGYQQIIDKVRHEYLLRRTELMNRLNIPSANSDGLCVWLPVDDEMQVISNLAAKNILVGAGHRYHLQESPPHIAIHIGNLSRSNGMIQTIASLLNRARNHATPRLFD